MDYTQQRWPYKKQLFYCQWLWLHVFGTQLTACGVYLEACCVPLSPKVCIAAGKYDVAVHEAAMM